MTHDEAYGPLLSACEDGTDVGLRDELVIRLGLMGMRRGLVRRQTQMCATLGRWPVEA